MKRLAFLILLLPLAALAACGGETSPEDDVTEVANQILEAKSPEQVKVVCQELITPGCSGPSTAASSPGVRINR